MRKKGSELCDSDGTVFVLSSDEALKRHCRVGCLCGWLRNRKQICVPVAVLLCECATASEQPGNAIPAQASSRIWAHVSLAEVTLALAQRAWIICTTCRNAV